MQHLYCLVLCIVGQLQEDEVSGGQNRKHILVIMYFAWSGCSLELGKAAVFLSS